MHEILAHLVPRSVIPQVVRGAPALGQLHRQRVHVGRGVGVGTDLADIGAHCGQEGVFWLGAQVKQCGIPLPVRVDTSEPPIVQFIAGVERQL